VKDRLATVDNPTVGTTRRLVLRERRARRPDIFMVIYRLPAQQMNNTIRLILGCMRPPPRFHGCLSGAFIPKAMTQLPSFPSFPLPPLLPFFLFVPFHIPYPSLPFPFLPLEVGPLKSIYRVWGSAVSSPAWSRAEPQPKSNLVHFSLKI